MMARVNKVIVGAHGVMANGGLITTAGCHLLALAAEHASVPLVACAGLYKLTPLFPSGPESFNMLLSPQPMVQYEEGLSGVHVPNPAYDYVPPELVSLLITNRSPLRVRDPLVTLHPSTLPPPFTHPAPPGTLSPPPFTFHLLPSINPHRLPSTILRSGPSHASYIYRLLAEYYHQEDYVLEDVAPLTEH